MPDESTGGASGTRSRALYQFRPAVTTTSPAGNQTSGSSYDQTDQLKTVTTTIPSSNESYSYDPSGNRQTSSRGADNLRYVTTTGNRLAADGKFN